MNKSADIFLSYNREDQAVARHFAEGLQHAGFSVWWDVTLTSGADYDKVTEDALRSAKAVVVLWSKKSVESRWVRAEATEAASLGTLVPVMIEPCKRPIMFELKQSAELSHWKGNAQDPVWQALVKDVQKFVARDDRVESQMSEPSNLTRSPKPKHRLGMVAALGVALLVLAGLGYGALRFLSNSSVGTGAVAGVADSNTKSASTTGISLAVLPFSNLSDDKAQDYFSDGLTDELINKLSNVVGMQVTGRNSSFYFKGRNDDLIQIGQKLGVEHVLQGSVRKSGSKIRITAQLMDVKENRNLWSQTYDKELTDIFTTQDEIAGAVTTALSITLRAGIFSQPGMTSNIEAYEEFLQARRQERVLTVASVKEAIDHIERAVSLDPKFVNAWELMSVIYGSGLILLDTKQSVSFIARRDEARKQMQSLSPESLAVKDLEIAKLRSEGKWIEAEQKIQEVLAASLTTDAATARNYAYLLESVGRIQDALYYGQQARRLEPLDAESPWQLAQLYLELGRNGEATQEIDKGLQLEGRKVFLSGLRLTAAVQIPDNAKGAMESLEKMNPVPYLPLLEATKLWLAGNKQQALAMAEQEISNKNNAPINRTVFGQLAVPLGKPQLAIDYALEGGRLAGTWMPYLSEGRKLPVFKELMRKQGFVNYWRTTGKWADKCHPVGDDFECN